jgi:hypothetical protein
MRSHFKGLFAAIGLILAITAFSGAKALAAAPATQQPGFNIITSPLPIKLTASPGQTVSTELRLKNQADQPEGIKVSLMKFGASGSDGTPDLYNLSPTDTYGSWVHFSPSTFVAQPNVWISVNMTINIPKSAALGYYLAVTFSPTSAGEGTGVTNLNGEVATLVLLNVQVPNEKSSVKLVSFQADHGLYEYLPVNFSIKIHNSGNIYTAPVGNIFIQKGGKTIDTLDVNDAAGSVLPGTNRVFTVPWSDGFPVFTEKLVNDKPVEGSNGIPEESLKWDFSQASKFRFGKYTANLLIVYDNGHNDVPQELSVNFWVFPWKLMLILLAVVILIGFGIFSFIRSIIRRARGGASKFQGYVKKK